MISGDELLSAGSFTACLTQVAAAATAYKSASLRGSTAGMSLVNTVLNKQYMDIPSNWGCLSDDSETQELTRVKVWREIESCKAILDNTLSDAANSCFLINSARSNVTRMRESSTSEQINVPVVGNITMERFEQLIQELSSMYAADLALKRQVLSDLSSSPTHDEAIVLLSLWQNAPSVDTTREELIHRIVAAETKSRSENTRFSTPSKSTDCSNSRSSATPNTSRSARRT